jgi:2-oxoglutarate ferredoxin oxidoreductase subunit alpha
MVRGALAAGCTFFAGYPITPASSILVTMMRELPKVGGIAIQAEDELASIGMCIGATMAGARAMTATSGPGISLYSENIGLAIMGEIPLVIVDVQRLGPSTGGATTVGQGDVQFVRWGTGGGYPIIALAPASIPDCYSLTMKAFDLAERFRCPVFVLTDKELNMTMNTVDVDQYEDVPVRERRTYQAKHDRDRIVAAYRYHPPDGVAPIAHYGEDIVVRFTGSTHDERAFITQHSPTVDALNRHLAAKIEEHVDEIEMVRADLEAGAETLLISYGITARAMCESVQQARAQGRKVSALTIQSLWPVPEIAIQTALAGVERIVVAELNLSQYRREIERIAHGHEILGLNRVDGELISPDQFLEMIR